MAEDIARPLCKCHGEPMSRNGHVDGQQRFQCAQRRREIARDAYWNKGQRALKLKRIRERRDAGVCHRCGGPVLSASLCWDCLNAMEERYALSI